VIAWTCNHMRAHISTWYWSANSTMIICSCCYTLQAGPEITKHLQDCSFDIVRPLSEGIKDNHKLPRSVYLAMYSIPMSYKNCYGPKDWGIISCYRLWLFSPATCLDRLWDQLSLLFNGWLEWEAHHSPPSSAEVKKWSVTSTTWNLCVDSFSIL
jgi:hypothetical protein